MKQAVEIKPYDARLVNRLNEIQYSANALNNEPIQVSDELNVKYECLMDALIFLYNHSFGVVSLLGRPNRRNLVLIHLILQPNPPVPTAYEQGCRGLFANRTSKLYCVYNTTTTAFLRLAPLKMEIIQLNPYMVLYHDVMTDSEMEHIKKLATPSLQRATVFRGNEKSVSNIRTSKSAWLPDNTDKVTKRVNTRITDMTGFDMRGSEMLQIGNYGIGGHYYNHYDFLNVSYITINR